MKKFLLTVGMVFILSPITNALADNQKSCSTTCYEKTPTCYVTKESDDCLDISYGKPVCDKKGSCTCVLPGCETKTTYEGDQKTSETVTPTTNAAPKSN